MCIEFSAGDFPTLGIELAEAAASKTNVNALFAGVVAKVVGVISVFESLQRFQ